MKLHNNYAKIISEALYKANQRTRRKILTPKPMLQRLPIAFARVKADNNSESLSSQSGQVVYSLHQSRDITKK